MASITPTTGLISGIDTASLIDKLMSLESAPKNLLQNRLDLANQKKLAFVDLSTRLTSLKVTAMTLEKPSAFQAATSTSSDQNVLTATVSNGANPGSYQFLIARMVAAQQSVTNGFADSDKSPVGTATQTISLNETPDPTLRPHVLLSQLRGGSGVSGGVFKITDRSGKSATIDARSASTLDDVVSLINNTTGISVKASYGTDGLILTDNSGGSQNNFIVADASGTMAANLGIVASTTSSTINGTDINFISPATQLSQLNNGKGVRTAGGSSPDFTINLSSGESFDITLANTGTTVQSVLDNINAIDPTKFKAELTSATDSSIKITDLTGGSGSFSITSYADSHAAADLGIQQTGTGGIIAGTALQSPLNTVQIAGKMTFELGGGDLTNQTSLSQLNGGNGVRRGVFRITDRSGNSANIDTSSAVTLDDVVKQINTSLDISIHASVKGNAIVLEDLTGKTASNLVVKDVAGGYAAQDLGLVTNTAQDTFTGSDIFYLGNTTSLTQLNDGRGVRTASSGADFKITVGSDAFNVSLSSARTLGDVISAINAVAPTKIKAQIASDGHSLSLTDLTSSGNLQVTALNGSKAAADLGIGKTTTGATLAGSAILGGLNTVLISSLNGGSGMTLGALTIKDRSGKTDTIDLSSATTVQDILDKINAGPNTQITASLNASGNGIQLVDKSNGTANDLTITDADANNTATALGIAGTFDSSYSAVSGANLQRQWITENTLLKDYNGGKGVAPGQFKITNAAGTSASFTVADDSQISLKDIITAINKSALNVTASINAHGDGLLLTDNTGGGGTLKVEDIGSTTAANLNILGTGTVKNGQTSPTIDGSFEKTVYIGAYDTLQDVQQKVNNANVGVLVNIINDGSSATPYRLTFNARNTGTLGRVVIDAGQTFLQSQNLVEGQDAAVFVGGTGTAQPLLVTSSKSQIQGVISGVTLNLNGASSSPVTLTVTRNADNIVTQMQAFTDSFNQMVDKITDLTKFDTDPTKRGMLLGDSTIESIQHQIYTSLINPISGAGRYRLFSDVGLTVADGSKIQFDEEKFRAAYSTDPDGVQKLFTLTQTINGKLTQAGLAGQLDKAISRLTDPVSGTITQQNNTLNSQTSQFQSRMDELDVLLAQKRTRLELQFANMETALSKLQTQQQSITQMAASFSSSK